MKERMRNEGERFYVLKLAERLCSLAMDLGEKTHISLKKLRKLEAVRNCEEERVTIRVKVTQYQTLKISVCFFFSFCLKLSNPSN